MNFQITKEQILQLHKMNNDGNDQLVKADLERWFPEAFKPELIIGNWYKHVYGALANYQGGSNGYGFNNINIWFNNERWDTFVHHPELWSEATEEEVKEALIVEAKKRGFVEGAKFIGIYGDHQILDRFDFWNLHTADRDSEKFNLSGCESEGVIFTDGKWAEVLPEEKPKEKTLEIVKGEKYICRKEVAMTPTDISFKRGMVYISKAAGNLQNESHRSHGLSPEFAYKHFLHLPK